jgi:hypothetical protein
LKLSRVTRRVSSFRFRFTTIAEIGWDYQFKSWEIDNLTTSRPYQVLSSDIANGPGSVNEVPVREDDAVLMTVQQAPVTWSSQTYTVRLILRGIVQWDWQVTFEVGMFPFRLDGTWTQH